MARVAAALFCCVALVSACVGSPAQTHSSETVPAIIVNPTERSRASLHDVVRKALARESVLLAEDALTTDSVLIIEPKRVRDPAGQLVTDNSVRVEHFQLVKRGENCVLIHERTGNRYTLSDTQCAPKR